MDPILDKAWDEIEKLEKENPDDHTLQMIFVPKKEVKEIGKEPESAHCVV